MKFIINDICFLNHLQSSDSRGLFEKIIPVNEFSFNVKEVFFSTSVQNTIRGMHIQRSPNPTAKIIKVMSGEVLDVILDCRKKSKTYGLFQCINLNQDSKALYIPKGCAHGFLTLSKISTMLYVTDDIYNRKTDSGYRYDSFGFEWPTKNENLSERDLKLPKFNRIL